MLSCRHFFVVGFQRCGTTYLYRLLDDHPEVQMARPLRPEPKFFLDPEHGDRATYERRFFAPSTAPVHGEKSTTYVESPAAVARILAMFPDARLVALVRDPLERAISNYRFTVEHGLETLSLTAAFEAELAGESRPYDAERLSTSPYAYLARGHYAERLDALAAAVGRERLHVALFEDLTDPEGSALAEVHRFLGIDPSYQPVSAGAVVNATSVAVDPLDPSTRERVRQHFERSDDALAMWLGRDLPWRPRSVGTN